MANGDHVDNHRYCRDLHIMIGGELFRIDCYVRALGSYDMVLNV
jgi:hypothetical protein